MITNSYINDKFKNTINNLLYSLNDNSKNRILDRLNKSKDYDSSFSVFLELVSGVIFIQAGIMLEYDYKIDKKTPDWTIFENNQINTIVEVKSIFPKEVWKNHDIIINNIKNEIKTIPIGVFLSLNFENELYKYKNIVVPSVISLKEKVNNWLINQNRTEVLEHYGLKFEIIEFNSEIKNVTLGILAPVTYWGYNINIEDDILRKLETYQSLIVQKNLPFILVLANTGVKTNVSFSDIERIFLGQDLFPIDIESNNIIGHYKSKYSKVNKLENLVNIVIWIEEGSINKWLIKIIDLNEYAINKINDSLLRKIQSLNNKHLDLSII